ncbi:glycosyltransferase family 2 protein [Microbacterium sp. A93]|uniref:glycosyltransferase family 2 protein n=1 Tax=Microbacterium sp. A93 TaxID=3450716 RepID=UPI003F433E61
MPTHKRPELMKLAVESILNQGAARTGEVIIVFDACPIEVPDVEVPDGWSVRGIANTRVRGLAGARNSGILDSKGDLVAFLDDDDEWLPGKLEAQLKRMDERPDAIAIATAMVLDDGVNNIVRLVEKDDLTHQDFLRDRHPGIPSGGLLFRRDVLLGPVGLIDEDLPRAYGEDYDLLLRASEHGIVTVVNEPLVKVRWQGQSYYFGQWAVYAEALQYLLRKHSDIATIPSALGRIEAQIAFALVANDQRSEGRKWAWRALRHNPKQIKAALAIAISWRLVSADAVIRFVRSRGRGI